MAQRNTGARKGMRKAALALALLLVLACLGGEMVFASDKIMDSSPAENLQVNVLYSDGSKMKEKTYSISDMKSLGLNEATYCYLDSLPCPCVTEAQGVYLTDLFGDLDLTEKDVDKMTFFSSDGGERSFRTSILNGYYYPGFVTGEYYTDPDASGYQLRFQDPDAAMEGAMPVMAMLALEETWYRVDAQGNKVEHGNTDTTFRLMMGAKKGLAKEPEITAPNSLKWIYKMDILTKTKNPDASSEGTGSGSSSGSGNGSGSGSGSSDSSSDEVKAVNGQVKLTNVMVQKNWGSLSDLDTHWAAPDVYKMVTLGSVNGYSDGTFRPDGTVTRAEFITMLMKSLVKTGNAELAGSNTFADVKGHWAENYIAAAVDRGIVNGLSSDVFAPDAKITRQQMAVMIVNAMKFTTTNKGYAPSDAQTIASWAKEATTICAEHEIMSSDSRGNFRPNDNATRAEAAVVLFRALKLKEYVVE